MCSERVCVFQGSLTPPGAPSSSYTPGSWQPDVSYRLTFPHRRNKYIIKDEAEGHKQPVSKAAVAPPAAASGRKSREGSVTASSVYKEMSHQKTKISLNRWETLGGGGTTILQVRSRKADAADGGFLYTNGRVDAAEAPELTAKLAGRVTCPHGGWMDKLASFPLDKNKIAAFWIFSSN